MKKKKFLSILLMIVMVIGLFSGCGDSQETETKIQNLETGENAGVQNDSDGQQEQKMGRFLETEVVLPLQPENIYCLGMTAENAVVGFVKDVNGIGHLISTTDLGESWDSKQVDIVQDSLVTGSGVTPEGGVLLVGVFAEDLDKCVLKKISADGSVSSVDVQLPEHTGFDNIGNMAYQGSVDTAGNLFIRDLNGDVMQVDTETGVCTKIGDYSDRISYLALAGEKLLLVTENGILVYGTADGKQQPQDAVLDDIIRSDASLASMDSDRALPLLFTAGIEEGSIVYANHQGVFYHRNGGSMAEQLINGELNSLGDLGGSLYGIVMPDEEHFLVNVSDAAGNEKILRFSYDKNISAVPEKELKVYALNDSVALRQAVTIYQNQNQNLYVNVEIGMNGAAGITAEDAISALNTKILAGDAPDVMILDGLPVDSYIEKGILADISGLVQQLEESDGLFTNVSSCYQENGAYYELPARFFPLIVAGENDAVKAGKNISDYADYINRMAEEGDTKVVAPRNAKLLLKILYQADAANWLKKDGSIDEVRLKEWLLAAKKIYDANEETKNEEAGSTDFFQSQLVATLNETYLFMGIKSVFGSIADMFNYVGLLATQEETGCSYGIFGSDKGNVFVPYLSVGISSASSVKEEAEGFFKILFGTECMSDGGFPINRKGWQELCAKTREDYGPDSMISVGFGTPDGGGTYGYMLNTFDEEAETKLNDMLESLTVRSARQDTAWEIVSETAESYLKGALSIEDALAAIQQKLTLYLAE